MRIPFDSLTLAAVVAELQPFVDGKLQRISQLDDHTIVLGFYAGAGEAYLLLSCDPVFFRVHFVTKRPPNLPQPPQFCAALRSRLDQSRLRSVHQVGFDRILILELQQLDGDYKLIAELMGKHSNLMLVGPDNKLVGVAKPIGVTKSVRVLLPGRPYSPPPLEKRPSLLNAKEGDNLRDFEGASPFLVKLLEAKRSSQASGVDPLRETQQIVRSAAYHPILSPGNGAYPISVADLVLPEFPRQSISIALEQHFALAETEHHSEQLRSSLLAQLNRVLLSRESAVSDLEQARDVASRAGKMQLQGELILAYGSGLPEGSSILEAVDYEGNPVAVRLDPQLSYMENSNRFFEKAKKAKSGQSMVEDQLLRLSKERNEISVFLTKVQNAERLDQLKELQEQARDRHWLFQQHVQAAKKEDRPYEGNRIRQILGPGGATVLFGENATSNDYLTLKVAKPDDYWLHVRGSVSAHVVIRTEKHPEKVGRELLMFAAKVAVQNSPSKHSGYVPVDYTLRKYVRKPRGAPVGTALYTHEKTVHVESGE